MVRQVFLFKIQSLQDVVDFAQMPVAKTSYIFTRMEAAKNETSSLQFHAANTARNARAT